MTPLKSFGLGLAKFLRACLLALVVGGVLAQITFPLLRLYSRDTHY
jgi:hypothetical protein